MSVPSYEDKWMIANSSNLEALGDADRWFYTPEMELFISSFQRTFPKSILTDKHAIAHNITTLRKRRFVTNKDEPVLGKSRSTLNPYKYLPSQKDFVRNLYKRYWIDTGHKGGRDNLAYTPEFEDIYAKFVDQFPYKTRHFVWCCLLSVGKSGKLSNDSFVPSLFD